MEYYDSIYGMHTLPDVCRVITETPAFQRLRHISVMGPVQWVVPSANHTMFEHSLGAAIMTHQWMLNLQRRYITRRIITSLDVQCATIASLTRHIGCMPWDTTYREFILDTMQDIKRRETFSAEIVDDFFKPGGPLVGFWKHRDMILGLIKGDVLGKYAFSFKRFMFSIVHDTRNDIDAAFLDRTMRDAHRLGMGHQIRMRSIIAASTITPDYALDFPLDVVLPILDLRTKIDMFVGGDTRVSAMCMLIKSVWAHVPMMTQAAMDPKFMMDVTDDTFNTHIHFSFFYQDMIAKRLPQLRSVDYMSNTDEVMAGMTKTWSVDHHLSTIRTGFKSYRFIVRQFYEI
jgi:hypothetical protein